MTLRVVDARERDVVAAALALEAAFAADPLIAYFFRTHPLGIGPASRQFFALLLRLRLAIGMPAIVLKGGEEVLGVAMGYDTGRPAWPEPYAGEWNRLEAGTPGLVDRMHAYETLSRSHAPTAPHHYLGVLGVHPSAHGTGGGKALLEAFCQRAESDPSSSGVYLETSNHASLEFYRRNRFELRGADKLVGASLWCVFRACDPGAGAAHSASSVGAADEKSNG